MCEHFILLLMQPRCPQIELRSGKQRLSLNAFFEEGFSQNATRSTFSIKDQDFTVHGFRLIHSDRQLRSIDGLESDSALRPDLIAFDQEYLLGDGPQPLNSLTVVEFKRPMRDDYTDDVNPLNQVFAVIDKVRSGRKLDANGRPIAVASPNIPTTCYVVCDLTPKLKQVLKERDATMLPDGQGFYGYSRNYNAYYEVLDYGKVLRDAQRRNGALFDKLKLI